MNEEAIANPAPLKELKPEFAPIVRHYPDTVNSFLRYQVLALHRRSSVKPLMDGLTLVGYAPDLPDNYFKLLGWGETLAAAKAMARGAR